MRCIVTVLVVAPFIAGHYLFPPIVSEMRENGSPMTSRVAVYLILVQIIPYFATGFVIFGLLRFIFNKM